MKSSFAETVIKAIRRGGARRLLVPALLALGMAGGRAAHANARAVPGAYSTLQDAVNAASPYDTILVADGLYTGPNNRNIDFSGKNLTIKSLNGPPNCVIDIQKQGSGFILQNGETSSSVIQGFTIKNAGMKFGIGGGVYAKNYNVTINNCVFSDCSANANGGGAYGGVCTNCVFTGCVANNGGALYQGIAVNCIFTGNAARQAGGAMYNGAATNCVFNGNTVTGSETLYTGGGGMYGGVAQNCAFTANASTTGGGGMEAGTATNCRFTSNSTSGGGGGMDTGTATNCVFNGNTASYGGGISNDAATNCFLINNTAASGGGGAFTATALNCVFYYNTTIGNGGGAEYGTCANCVFFANTASAHGGGASNASLLHCAVVNNSAGGSAAGGIYNNVIAYSVINSIVWNNSCSAGAGTAEDNILDFQTGGHGLLVTYSDVQGGYNGAGNSNADPQFVNLASGDLHLSANSPCIDKGTSAPPAYAFTEPAADLDGAARIVGPAPDMGAYETSAPGIGGTLTFDGLVPSASPQNVVFQLRPLTGGGSPITKTVSILPNGAFRLYGIPAGNYDIWIKPDTFLASVVRVNDSSGAVSGVTALLMGGDANNDNSVDSTDFGLLIGAFNSQANLAGSGYDVRADFNGDGFVDSTDFGILIGNFNKSGAP